MWIIVGPLTVVLHIVSNTVGALLIRSTPGYQDIDVGQLILLWCTRPRMAWMVIALIPWQAKNAIYFSVAASSILSEAILQILGSVYMGIATAYAGRQKFYRVGRLRHVPHGTDALVMYAGSLLWLVMIIFALVACGWTLLNVNRHVAGLAQRARGLPRQANKQHRTANHRIGKWVKRQAEFQKRQENSTRSTQECDADREALVAQYLPLRQAWQDLASRWANLHEYLTEDVKAIKAARKDLRKRGQMLRRAKRRGTSAVIEQRYFVDAQSLVENLVGLWRSKPANSLEEVQGQNRLFQESQNAANESKRDMLVRLNEEEKGHEEDWRRLEEINKQIWDLDRRINLKTAQLQAPSRLTSYTVDGPPEADITSLRAERERLVAERGSIGPGEAGSGLLRRLARYKQYLPQLAEIHGEWGAIVQGWDEIVKSVMTLENRWGSLSTQRQREEEEEKQDPGTKLRVIAAKALVGMIGCWAAQWVWWVGYIRLAGDS
jgi:hypothetical protein